MNVLADIFKLMEQSFPYILVLLYGLSCYNLGKFIIYRREGKILDRAFMLIKVMSDRIEELNSSKKNHEESLKHNETSDCDKKK